MLSVKTRKDTKLQKSELIEEYVEKWIKDSTFTEKHFYTEETLLKHTTVLYRLRTHYYIIAK